MAFIAQACADALRKHPLLNAALDGDTIVYKKDINMGIAVAIEGGLIVPVVARRQVRLLDLSAAIADVAARARAKQLKPEEVHGGTFTITNPGAARRAIRHAHHQPAAGGHPGRRHDRKARGGGGRRGGGPAMAYLTLGFDHRLVDGFVADQFMADVKRLLEVESQ